ncbi:tellurite resistance TerB family protein [Sedimentitalea sp. JM2-8]|uniref:Tellurite resistance TerB family protein n=1 Tax=Sedimentitalea xiamensis TaxID=3050037 RepID=A0ABT7FD85_9RHOB|nr:tellurite resistance TerB family protein [Sedimentitalea xiamensis]MDK3073081.1 tellurite resistance TerB family protein [Sedimentitalea xiamensis]
MSLMGTLAKVAIGYAAARGIDRMGGSKGIGELFGGARISPDEAEADQAPGLGNMQDMMSQMASGSGMGGLQDMLAKMSGGGGLADMQNMIAKMAGQSGFDLSSMLGGGASSGDKGGLLSGAATGGGAGAGLAGILAALGGAAAVTGKSTSAMIDQFDTARTAPQAEDAAGLMLRAMIQAAKADGEIDRAEQDKIMETVGEDADAKDIAFVKAQLAAPVDVESLAADTPDAQKMQVYAMSLMSIRLDTQGEAHYLDRLARALGLNQQIVNALHLQMGAQPLYA